MPNDPGYTYDCHRNQMIPWNGYRSRLDRHAPGPSALCRCLFEELKPSPFALCSTWSSSNACNTVHDTGSWLLDPAKSWRGTAGLDSHDTFSMD